MVITAVWAVRSIWSATKRARNGAGRSACKPANGRACDKVLIRRIGNGRAKDSPCKPACTGVLHTARKRRCDEKKNDEFLHDGLPRNGVVMSPDSNAHTIETKGKIP
jgi:hypothetical protein